MARRRAAVSRKFRLTLSELLIEGDAAVHRSDLNLGSQYFNQALESDPNDPRIHLALGNLYLKSGQASKAEAAYKTAQGIRPDLSDATAGLVKVRVAMRLVDEAEAICREFLIQFPNDLVVGQLLAQILLDQRRTAEAIELMRLLVIEHPDAVTTMNSLAKRLSEQGDFDEARKYFELAISADRSNAFAYLGWIQTKKITVEDKEIVQGMEAALSDRSLSESDRMNILFALGKTYGDLEDFQMSMDSYRQANEIRESSSQKRQPFQREVIQGTLDLTREIFTRSNIALRQSYYSAAPTPIFIVGMFRSGTTLVEQILSNHRSVVAGGEIPYWMDVSAACFDHSRRSFDFERAKVLRKPYQLKLSGLSATAEFATDKMPGNYRLLGLLRILFPKAKFIHCTRHPVDTCLSIYMTPFNMPPNYASDPEKLIFTYRLYQQAMDHWREVLGKTDIHEVCYEDLAKDPEAVTRRILEFCDLEFDEACLFPERNERVVTTASAWQVRQPVYRSSVEKWRQYEPWLGEFRKLFT